MKWYEVTIGVLVINFNENRSLMYIFRRLTLVNTFGKDDTTLHIIHILYIY